MLTAIRVMAETAEAAPAAPLDVLLDDVLAAADEIVRRTREMLPALTRGRSGRRRCGRPGRVRPRRGGRAARRAAADDRRAGGRPDRHRCRARATVHLPLLHDVRAGGRARRPRAARGAARPARRLAAGGRRVAHVQGARAYRRPRRGAHAGRLRWAPSTASRSPTCTTRPSSERCGCWRRSSPSGSRPAGWSRSSAATLTRRAFRALGATTVIGGPVDEPLDPASLPTLSRRPAAKGSSCCPTTAT